MSRDQLFDAANSEYVTQRTPNQNGEDFKLLHGAGPNALPSTLGTSQGNSNSDNGSNDPHDGVGNPSVPFGTLVRNPNIASLSDQVTSSNVYSFGTVSGNTILASDSFAGIAIAFNSFSGTLTQALPNLLTYGVNGATISNVVINNVYSGNSVTGSSTYPLSNVNASGAGWTQSGYNIVWSNGIYTSFSGAATASAMPASGQTYYLAVSYTATVPGTLVPGLVGALSVPQSVEDAWIGNNVFGKSVYGDPEVQITNFGSTRDTISAGSNVNPIITPPNTYAPNSLQNYSDVIPSVGSRFYRG